MAHTIHCATVARIASNVCIACIAFYAYIASMRNKKSIADISQNVKHAEMLRIAPRKDYKDIPNMSRTVPKVASKATPAKTKRTIQPKIDATEVDRLHSLAVRFDRIVVERNARLNENARCDVEDTHLVYAGLIALERTKSDADFYACVIDGQNRR
jgi:hypothetical protein